MLKSCASDARTVADECKATCTTAVDAAHAACEADPASQDCHDKRVAASECLRPCYAMQGQATADCVIKVRACVAGCPDQPQPSGQ